MIWVRSIAILGLLGLGVLLFFAVEQPIERGTSNLRLGADTQTYYLFADSFHRGATGEAEALTITGNLFGPVFMALVLKLPIWVMVCNFFLFFAAIYACRDISHLSRSKLVLLLALNATTLVSLVTLNKEIFTLMSSLLLCRYLYGDKSQKRRSVILASAILLIGLLARWEQAAITFLFFLFWRKQSFFRRHPRSTLIMVILGITVAYPLALRLIDLSAFTDQGLNGGTIVTLNRIQASFGYPLVLVPKAMMSLFGNLLRPISWLGDFAELDPNDLANRYIINLHCLAMLLIIFTAFVKGRLSIDRPLPFFIALYLIVTSANAFLQPRYQYPVYVLLCFELAREEDTGGVLHRLFGQPKRYRTEAAEAS